MQSHDPAKTYDPDNVLPSLSVIGLPVAGYATDDFDGFTAGYAAGFTAGAEVAGTRLLLGIEHALRRIAPGRALDLFAGLPDVAGYLDYRRRTSFTDDPCRSRCGRCSACIRAAEVTRNLSRYGRPDFPGRRAGEHGGSVGVAA